MSTNNALNNSSSPFAVNNLNLNGNTISSTDTNGNIVLAPDGSGEVSVTAAPIVPSTDRADSLGSVTNSWDNVYADGVSFDDGTNILSAYEQGTWTPAITFGGSATGVTYSTQNGDYVRIGNVVHIGLEIRLTSKGTDTGSFRITSLPFTAGVGIQQPQGTMMGGALTAAGGRTYFTCSAVNNSTEILVSEVGAAGNTVVLMTDASVANTSLFRGGLFYFL